MKAFLLSYVLFSILLINDIYSLEFKDCGSELAKFTSVKVSDCDETKHTCVLKRNTNATVVVDFSLTETDSVEKINTVVHGVIVGVPVPFPLPDPDACVNHGLSCPLKKDETNTYYATLQVLKSYPKVIVDVKWELQNEDKKVLICVLIPAKIE